MKGERGDENPNGCIVLGPGRRGGHPAGLCQDMAHGAGGRRDARATPALSPLPRLVLMAQGRAGQGQPRPAPWAAGGGKSTGDPELGMAGGSRGVLVLWVLVLGGELHPVTPGCWSLSCCWSLCAGISFPSTATSGPWPPQPGPWGPSGHRRDLGWSTKLFSAPKFTLHVPSLQQGGAGWGWGPCAGPSRRWVPGTCGIWRDMVRTQKWVSTSRAGGGCWVLGGARTRLGASWARGGSQGPRVGLSRLPHPPPATSAWPSHPDMGRGALSLSPLHWRGPHPPLEGWSHPGPERRSQLRRLPASGGGGRRGPCCQMEPAPRCNISGR